MKIAFEGQPFLDSFKTGIGWYEYNMIKNITRIDSESQFEITVFDFLNSYNSDEKLLNLFDHRENTNVSKCIYMHYGIYIRSQNLFKWIPYNYLFNSKADIYHFFNFIIPPRIKGKVVNTVHDMVYFRYPETMSKANYNIQRKNLNRWCQDADIILTVSQNSKNEISEFMNVPLDKIEIAYPAVDRNVFSPKKDYKLIEEKYNITSGYILYFGTLEPRKNITTIIRAFKIISEKNKDIKLVLAGRKGWLYDEIFALVQELRLEDRIIFTGYVPEEDAPVLYSCAEAFVFPSLYEGFGIPPLEAMACGTPVIVSKTASLPEVVGDAGILVDPHDIENLAFEMERLINDSALRKRCSEKGLVQADKFSWEDSARKVIEIYKSLA